MRYAFNRRLFAEARYEETNGGNAGFTRDGVLMMGYGPTENTRVTIEDVISQQLSQRDTVNMQVTIGY